MAAPLASSEAVEVLTAEHGASSTISDEREAAQLSLSSAMAENASGVAAQLMPRLRSMLDLTEHNSLSPTHIQIFQAPPGMSSYTYDVARSSLSRYQARKSPHK